MREIKVRFWDEVNKKFWFGGQEGESDGAETFQTWFDNGVLKGFMYEEVSYGFSPIDDVKHRDLITSQWTGLKDKNNKGKEIFEGDIVEFNNCNYLRTGGYLDDEILRGKVIFAYGGWMIKTNKGDYDLYPSIFNDEELEVIGNVFEDSHLLEEQYG